MQDPSNAVYVNALSLYLKEGSTQHYEIHYTIYPSSTVYFHYYDVENFTYLVSPKSQTDKKLF